MVKFSNDNLSDILGEYKDLLAKYSRSDYPSFNLTARICDLRENVYQITSLITNKPISTTSAILNEAFKYEYWKDTFTKLCDDSIGGLIQPTQLDKYLYPECRRGILTSISKGTYEWSVPTKLEIRKPGSLKKRVVYMYSNKDRLVMGVITRVMVKFYDDTLNDCLFSYRKGVSAFDAIRYALKKVKENIDPTLQTPVWCVKIDISKYFNSVPKQGVVDLLDSIFKVESDEPEILNNLRGVLLNDMVIHNNHLITEYKALTPGASFSGFLANKYLGKIDDVMSNQSNLVYVRYSDDIILIAKSKDDLQGHLNNLISMLNDKGLNVNPHKYVWYEPNQPITFLGFQFTIGNGNPKIDVSKEAFKSLKRKIKEMYREHLKRKDKVRASKKMLERINNTLYRCYIQDARKYGWGYYMFRYINTIDTLRELDFYVINTIRALLSGGKHNKGSIGRFPLSYLKELGYVSSVDMYNLFKADFDLYCDQVYYLERGKVYKDTNTSNQEEVIL